MLELIESSLGLGGEFGKSDQDQKSADDVVTLNTGFATLTVLKPRHLLGLTVQLLDFPAAATHLSCGLSRVLSRVVDPSITAAVKPG